MDKADIFILFLIGNIIFWVVIIMFGVGITRASETDLDAPDKEECFLSKLFFDGS